MGDLLIRDVPDDLKDNLAAAARKAGRSVDEEARLRLRVSANGDGAPEARQAPMSGAEFVRSIQALVADIPLEEREAFSAIMDDIEAGRKRDAGRPSPFEE
ncbi:FitA-like ribbon-helix-helix domain-containing protein [Rhizobium sp.]